METIPQFEFHKTKYGDELLIDVVELAFIKKYIAEHSVHKLAYYDITLISEGAGYFHIDDRRYTVQPDDVVVSRPGEIREWDKDNIRNGYALIFEEEFLLSFFNDPDFLRHLSYFRQGTSSKISLDDETATRIAGLMKNIKNEIDSYQIKDKHILRALLYETLMLLNRTHVSTNGSADETRKTPNQHVDKFIALVNKDFKHHHSICYFADKLYITSNYLNEIVKNKTGVTAKQHIQDKIILETKKMLVYTNLSIVEIAAGLGFDDSSYFARFFHKQTGTTPLQYRKTVRS